MNRHMEKRPEEFGVSPARILEMLALFEQKIHSVHGFALAGEAGVIMQGAWAPIDTQIPRNGYSLAKSLTSLAIGFAIDEGLLSFDTEVVPLFRDELPDCYDSRLEHMTVRDLLTMAASSAVASTNFQDVPDDRWVTYYFSLVPYAQPGTEFHYDTGGMYLLSCIISKVTGRNTFRYLQEKLFEPLGIMRGWWLEDGKGRNVGGWGIYLSIADGVKIAQMLACGGRWEDRQIVPAWYIHELADKKIETAQAPHLGWPYGYSYGFWMGNGSVFLAFGAFGQLWICDPDHRLAVIVNAGCSHEENQLLLEIVQNTLLSTVSEGPIPLEDEHYLTLKKYLETRALACPAGCAAPANKTIYGTYQMAENQAGYQALTLKPLECNVLELTFTFHDRVSRIRMGYQAWITQDSNLDLKPNVQQSLSYAWEENELSVVQQQLNQPSSRRYHFAFLDGTVVFTVSTHPSLTSDPPEEIHGVQKS